MILIKNILKSLIPNLRNFFKPIVLIKILCRAQLNETESLYWKLHLTTRDSHLWFYLPHFLDATLGSPSYIIGCFKCSRLPYHFSNAPQFYLSHHSLSQSYLSHPSSEDPQILVTSQGDLCVSPTSSSMLKHSGFRILVNMSGGLEVISHSINVFCWVYFWGLYLPLLKWYCICLWPFKKSYRKDKQYSRPRAQNLGSCNYSHWVAYNLGSLNVYFNYMSAYLFFPFFYFFLYHEVMEKNLMLLYK